MKTIFIMGILSYFCGISDEQPQYCISDEQPQYCGEGAYDLENVVFGMKVDKYYSKAKPYDGYPDKSFRYFDKEKKICKTKKGKKAVIYQYSSIETNYGEVLARFGNFEFPYTGMLADKSGKLIGILAQGRLDGTAAVDSQKRTTEKCLPASGTLNSLIPVCWRTNQENLSAFWHREGWTERQQWIRFYMLWRKNTVRNAI